jgi:hypothetical protein
VHIVQYIIIYFLDVDTGRQEKDRDWKLRQTAAPSVLLILSGRILTTFSWAKVHSKSGNFYLSWYLTLRETNFNFFFSFFLLGQTYHPDAKKSKLNMPKEKNPNWLAHGLLGWHGLICLDFMTHQMFVESIEIRNLWC